MALPSSPALGLSPPTRGSHKPPEVRCLHHGSIPAHTGKPAAHAGPPLHVRVYPRPHGEAERCTRTLLALRGLSPPTRGSLLQRGKAATQLRSIPAHTGKPSRPSESRERTTVYPRPHGEATAHRGYELPDTGLSPPTRGSRVVRVVAQGRQRSIPAHTGKPIPHMGHRPSWTVYPRPHGEAMSLFGLPWPVSGLSPPTRGSPRPPGRRSLNEGSIPAHTGKPVFMLFSSWRVGVYPRPHGEAGEWMSRTSGDKGLSPPTRGSLSSCCSPLGGLGSIPAHTGKPASGCRARRATRVYPRPHGEAYRRRREGLPGQGLSPPTRGSPSGFDGQGFAAGSIPAHTGKPLSMAVRQVLEMVYPRPHGEAMSYGILARTGGGLSPPTRGSLTIESVVNTNSRSIPAHTGKPRRARRGRLATGVYPRPHGEAYLGSTWYNNWDGLSPPTRGSLALRTEHLVHAGSIPAHTGKPLAEDGPKPRWRVYPRPHGEAPVAALAGDLDEGLSPPTRGSLARTGPTRRDKRSIPAHTGKPTPKGRAARQGTVYPRPHGEASTMTEGRTKVQGLSPPTRGSPRLLWV